MKGVTLVVGGSRGIGRAITAVLGNAGHNVVALGRRPVAESIAPVRCWSADITDDTACETALAEISAQCGPIRHVVFVQRFRGDGDSWIGEMDVTLHSTRRLIEALKPQFTAGSSIVVVASVNARWITRELPASYHVAKAALVQLARFYAVTLGPSGVRVNVISPGSVIKDEAREFFAANPQIEELYARIVPLRRMGRPQDVAGVVEFLCGDGAAFVTGQEIVVDGGLSLELQESVARRLTNA